MRAYVANACIIQLYTRQVRSPALACPQLMGAMMGEVVDATKTPATEIIYRFYLCSHTKCYALVMQALSETHFHLP